MQPYRKYLVGTPRGRLTQMEKQFLAKPWSEVRDTVQVKLVEQDGELYVLARSGTLRDKEQGMRRRRLRKLLKRLHELRQQIRHTIINYNCMTAWHTWRTVTAGSLARAGAGGSGLVRADLRSEHGSRSGSERPSSVAHRRGLYALRYRTRYGVSRVDSGLRSGRICWDRLGRCREW
jgi:hypothetical protein